MIEKLAIACLETARARGIQIATAESCTGGMIAAALTDIAGSSDVFDRGFVTYSNKAKNELIGVPMDLIEKHGAVSEEVAKAMADGALARSNAHMVISVTGVAGPGGGSAEKPVGLVHFGLAFAGAATDTFHEFFADEDRAGVRAKTVVRALNAMVSRMKA
ncbi:MAG: CinA family protein [Pseudomonadota bacterium]